MPVLERDECPRLVQDVRGDLVYLLVRRHPNLDVGGLEEALEFVDPGDLDRHGYLFPT
jgi:hypothetical protein